MVCRRENPDCVYEREYGHKGKYSEHWRQKAQKTGSRRSEGNKFVIAVQAHESKHNSQQGRYRSRKHNEPRHSEKDQLGDVFQAARRSEKNTHELEKLSRNEQEAGPREANEHRGTLLAQNVGVESLFHGGVIYPMKVDKVNCKDEAGMEYIRLRLEEKGDSPEKTVKICRQ